MRDEATLAQIARDRFLEALADHIDARIDYRLAEAEWRSGNEVTRTMDALDQALEALLKHG